MQINLRCFKCSTPFVIKPDEVKAALDMVHTEGLKHYNVHCPKCGRANKISKKQLRRALPNWVPPKKQAKRTTKQQDTKTTSNSIKDTDSSVLTPATKTKTKTKSKAKTKTTSKPSKKTGSKTTQKTPKAKTTRKTRSKTTKKTSTKKK